MILEEVMYRSDILYDPGSSLFKIVIGYTKRDKNSIGGHECAVFWYDQL